MAADSSRSPRRRLAPRHCDRLPDGRILAYVSAPSTFQCDLPDALLQRARRGDEQAFEQIYRRFERPIFALAARLLGSPDDAMDVVHDALLKVFRHLDRFRGEAPFWAWVRQIAHNEVMMRLRRRDPLQGSEAVDEECAELSADPDQVASTAPWASAEQSLLERALQQLPDITRAVIWLYHVEGLTHEEIADSMGRTRSFSKSQLARGTQRLRVLLRISTEVTPYA